MADKKPMWQMTYGIGRQKTKGTAVNCGDYIASTSTGQEGGLAIIGYPNFDPGLNIIDTRKATGVPYRKTIEYLQGDKDPTLSLEMDATILNLILIISSLVGDSIDEADASVYEKIFTIYSSMPSYTGRSSDTLADTTLYTLYQNTGVANESIRITDAICSSMTFSGAEGEPWKVTSEWMGAKYETDVDCSVGSHDFTIPTTQNTPLMFRDAYIRLGGGSNLEVSSLSLTATSNLVAKHQASGRGSDQEYPNEFLWQDFTVSGSLVIPWNGNNATYIDKFIDGSGGRPQYTLLEISNQSEYTVNAAGIYYFKSNIRFTGITREGDDEQDLNISFEGVGDGTNPVFRCEIADDQDWGFPT